MRERLEKFDALGVRLACVVQGAPQQAEGFCARHGLAGRCIPDPEKESYRAMGFPRTSWGSLIFASEDLRRRRKEAKAAGCSNHVGRAFLKSSDILQLPGAALIARGGRVLWLHRGAHPGDLPAADELLRIAQAHLTH